MPPNVSEFAERLCNVYARLRETGSDVSQVRKGRRPFWCDFDFDPLTIHTSRTAVRVDGSDAAIAVSHESQQVSEACETDQRIQRSQEQFRTAEL